MALRCETRVVVSGASLVTLTLTGDASGLPAPSRVLMNRGNCVPSAPAMALATRGDRSVTSTSSNTVLGTTDARISDCTSSTLLDRPSCVITARATVALDTTWAYDN